MEQREAPKKRSAFWITMIIIACVIVGLFLLGIGIAIYYYASDNSDYNGTGGYKTISSYDDDDYDYDSATPMAEESALDDDYESSSSSKQSSSVSDSTSSETGSISEKKVIKTADLSIEVKKAEDSITELNNLAASKNGFVLSSRVYTNSDESKSAYVTIKVPADKFNESVEAIKKIAKNVTDETISGKDVTEKYTDLQSQLKNYRAEEAQYLKILEQATTVEDLLKVHDSLAYTRESIELIEGKIKYLESQTDLSAITIEIEEETKVGAISNEWKPLTTLKKAFNSWVSVLQGIVSFLIYIAFYIIPLAIIVWIIVVIIKRGRRKKLEQ